MLKNKGRVTQSLPCRNSQFHSPIRHLFPFWFSPWHRKVLGYLPQPCHYLRKWNNCGLQVKLTSGWEVHYATTGGTDIWPDYLIWCIDFHKKPRPFGRQIIVSTTLSGHSILKNTCKIKLLKYPILNNLKLGWLPNSIANDSFYTIRR